MILGIIASSVRRATNLDVLWTPANITTELWLDALDDDAFILTGSSIDQWSDKSGNARHAIPATATKPTRGIGINGLQSTIFGSGTDPLITPSFDNPTGADGLTVATVMRRTGQPVNFSDPFCKGAVNAEWSLVWASNLGALPVNDRNASFWRGNAASNDTAISPSQSLADGATYLWSGAMSDASNKQFLQGIELAGSQGVTTHSFGGPSVLTIGSSPDSTYATNRYQGEIGEMVVVYADTRDVIRQQTEGYLAHKWGFQGDLPITHPYKNGPPLFDPHWNDVELLLYMDGVNGATTFTDYSLDARSSTVYGVTTVSTSESKFGGTSMFNGSANSGNGLEINPIPNNLLVYPGDFTIELWYYQTADSEFLFSGLVTRVNTNNRTSANDTSIEIGISSSGGNYIPSILSFNTNTQTNAQLLSSIATNLNEWNHLAVTRSGNDLRMFVNGNLAGTRTVTGAMVSNTSSPFIGASYQSTSTGGRHSFKGYIDAVRITRGVARYTSSFALPTSPPPIQKEILPLYWTPSDTNTAIWYDPSDPNTVNILSGAVNSITDKSGNERILSQGTVNRRPAPGVINGQSSLVFDGTDDVLGSASAIEIHAGPWTSFAVAAGSGTGIILAQQTSLGVAQYVRQGATNYAAVPFEQGPATYGVAAPAAADMNAPALFTSRFNGAVAISSHNGVDGTPQTSWSATPVVGPDQISFGDYLTTAVGQPYDGNAGSVILVSGSLGTAMRQRFEGFLAHQWGLESELSFTHPYRYEPPPREYILPETWSLQTNSFGTDAVADARNFVRGGERLWVVCGGSTLETSPDGVNWTPRSHGLSANLYAVACDHLGNIIVVNDTGSPDASRSTDGGVNWTTQTINAAVSQRGIAHDKKGLWVAVGDAGSLRTSTNGTSWTARTSTFSATRIWCVEYGEGLWMAGGEDGKIATSTNGTAWTARTSGFGASTIRGMCRANGLSVAVGTDGKIAISRDGIFWAIQPSGTTQTLISVRYADGAYWVCGAGDTVLYSETGTNWTQLTVPSMTTCRAISYDEESTFVLTGNAGAIYTAQRPVPRLWTPSDITTALWLDAADANTITDAGAGKVSQWDDKSGNSRNVLQGTDAIRPTIVAAAQNGLDAIRFDGIDDEMSTSVDFPLIGNPAFSSFMAVRRGATGNIQCGWGNNNTREGSCPNGNRWAYLNSNNFNAATDLAANNAGIIGYTKSPGAIDTTSNLYLNGTLNNGTGHSTGTPNILSRPLVLGRLANWAESPHMDADMYEWIIVPSNVSTDIRQRIEGYLAHKWGLTDELPADHPYKNTAPTVNENPLWTPANITTAMWLDASDQDTVRQNNNGVLPADTGTVGCLIGKDSAVSLGSQLVTNGGFETNTTGWTNYNGATVSIVPEGVQITASVGGYRGIYQDIAVSANTWYEFTLDYYDRGASTGGAFVWVPNFTGDPLLTFTSAPNRTLVYTDALTTVRVYFSSSPGTTSVFKGVSLRAIGGAHARQTASAARPQRIAAGLNGLDVLRYDGTDDFMSAVGPISAGLTRNVGEFNYWIVADIAANPSGVIGRVVNFSVGDVYGTNFRTGLYTATGVLRSAQRRLDSTTSSVLETAYTTRTSQIVHTQSLWSAAQLNRRINGGPLISQATGQGSGNTSDTNSNEVVFGGTDTIAAQFNAMDFGEFIGIVGSVTEATRQQIEGYLAHKWGLTAGLPADHPYKNAAPTIL